MQVIGTIDIADKPALLPAVHVSASGTVRQMENPVQEESLLDVYVNDILTMRLGCSANHLVELVVGRLFTEGLIHGIDEIEAISICEFSMRADVVLKDRRADLSRKASDIVPTCCTQNRTLNDFFGTGEALMPVEPITWNTDWVLRMAREFAKDKTAHARTRGVHSAYLATPNATLCIREDIGRHNAFDKAIGWALMNDVDLSQCMLFTSGRVPTDMVTKAIRARIPLLVSKAVATDKTVRIAQEYSLALVCSAKPDGFDVMNDPGMVCPTRQEKTA